nr:MAG TPA: hypothetical protein [Caudoviricetes sp.]
MEQEIEQKILSWKVKKMGDGDYRVIRPHKFIMVVDEYDTEVFNNRMMAEYKAEVLNDAEKIKEEEHNEI